MEGGNVPDNSANVETLGKIQGRFSPPKISSFRDPSNLVKLIEELGKIDTCGTMAKLNKTTISDNNGGRIEL